MSVSINNAVIRDLLTYTPASDTQVTKPYNDGFLVLATGTVVFRFEASPTVTHSLAFDAGDTFFADKIYSVDSATGASIKLVQLKP